MSINVYMLLDTASGDSLAIYVGITSKTLEGRLKEHLRYLKKRTLKTCWIRSLLSKGITPSIQLIDTCDTWSEACELEQYWIQEAKDSGFRVKNSTLGGDGVYGIRLTEEHKRKISEAGRGRRATDETRRKLSLAKTGICPSAETRGKISAARAGKPGHKQTDEAKRKLRLAKCGVVRPGIAVVNIRTSETFDSIAKAAASCGANPQRLYIDLRSGRSKDFRYVSHVYTPTTKTGLKGRVFSADTKQAMSKNSAWGRPVRHKASGRVFSSASSAAIAFGIKPGTLLARLNKKRTEEFEYVEGKHADHPRSNQSRVPKQG